MTKKRRWLWVVLFIFIALLLSILATGWNVVLIRDYQRIIELAKNFSLPLDFSTLPTHIVLKMIMGTLGFVAALCLSVLIFAKLLHEMRLNQLQGEFLATVSHELKTPIASMELTSSLIRSGGLSESETTQLWASHQAELIRLRKGVEALLEAARWQSKPLLDKNTSVSLESWLQQSFENWKSILGSPSELSREGVPLHHNATLNIRTLNLIVDNLIGNAKKFSKGSPSVKVLTTYVPREGFFSKAKWRIQIQDQGWGFDPADSTRIFHRFYRSKSHAPYSIPGTGLGLFLAITGSKAMGISLTAVSPGKGLGATFTLEGPVL